MKRLWVWFDHAGDYQLLLERLDPLWNFGLQTFFSVEPVSLTLLSGICRQETCAVLSQATYPIQD